MTSDRILCAATCIGDHIMFENLEPPEEGKSIEFPRKHAILADCTTIDEPVYGIRHIGERIIRGCASAVLCDCNMIELVHAKLTHTYAATRRPSGTHVGRAAVSLSVFQICLSLLKKGRVLDSPENM